MLVEIFGKARLGGLNLHPSLLPKYRGMSPQHWPIILGDKETGVTVHRMEKVVDTGDIIRQCRIPLRSDIYIHELQKRFLEIYRIIMVESVSRLIEGERGEKQNSKDATYFPRIKDFDMEINCDTSVEYAYGLIRAFSYPYKGAVFQGVRIMRAKLVDQKEYYEISAQNSQIGIREQRGKKLLVLCDGA